jgi:hypothetical protein
VSCTRCLAQGLQCDNESRCKHCSPSLRPCECIMCERYKIGKCPSGACKYAYEGDRFDRLVALTHVNQIAVAPIKVQNWGFNPWKGTFFVV